MPVSRLDARVQFGGEFRLLSFPDGIFGSVRGAKASIRRGREREREKQLREVPKTDARVGFFNEIQSVI